MDYSADAGQKIVKMLDTLKNQLTASGKEIFIYELLQNANDYPNVIQDQKEKVDVEFHITPSSLVFLHSGAKFNERNIAAICSINDKEKTDNKETIGYKGIGFKTVFLDNNYVYIQTGDFSFRFDREYSRDIVDTPWQILPIWTKYNELSQAEKYIFTNADSRFRVKFALRPTNVKTLRDSPQNYVKMFMEVFQNERVILFIPNISSVKVFFRGTSIPDIDCHCDSNQWRVDDFEEDVPLNITESINSDIEEQEDSGSLKIPTKYYNFTKTKVSFACEIDGTSLKEVENTQIYCYLPTRASWGFKFLMNTDMIPTGPRDDIEIDFSEQININAEISQIAGSKFFDWLKKLCDTRQFELCTIFGLIPAFDTCITQHGKYKVLICRFKDGFDEKLRTEKLIPIKEGEYSLLKNVILDETGITSSGIMSDDDFFENSELSGCLPIGDLRNNRKFNNFLRRYLKEFDLENNIWNFDDLKESCSEDSFRRWLKDQNNNNNFLDFLIKKDVLSDFLDEEIFLSSDGVLCRASNLYYDIDQYLGDLQAFREYLPVLSFETRNFFNGNNSWYEVIFGAFDVFNCGSFVDNVLLSKDNEKSTVEKLKDRRTSIHFFKFLAENVPFDKKYMSLPFFDDKENVVNNFNDGFLFFTSERGNEVCASVWLKKITIHFVSDLYLPITKQYFKDNFNVREYADNIIVLDIILSDDYDYKVSSAIDDNIEKSIDFISFCFENDESIPKNGLAHYYLHVYNCAGKEDWFTVEEDTFFSSSVFDYYSKKEWLDNGMMASLDEAYFTISPNREQLKKFFERTFGVEELTDKTFYRYIVKKKDKRKEIFFNIKGENDSDGHKNIDFVRYLDDNFQLIFVEEKDGDAFDDLIIINNEVYDVSLSDECLYIFDSELKEIIDCDWFPKDIVSLAHPDYGKSKALAALGVKAYKFGDFFDDVIAENISSINKTITTKEESVSFHNFIISQLGSLTLSQQEKMKDAVVYLYGQDEPIDNAGGHKTLSANAKELFNLGLVEFSDLDIIDPDYKTEDNIEYWETRLGNTKFTVDHFFSWLKDNFDDFKDTLEDEKLNISFWRWMNNNVSDKMIVETIGLPLILKNGDVTVEGPIYFSDDYLSGAGIENSITMFDDEAKFLSPVYIVEGEDVDEWKSFFSKVNIKCEIVDILVETVIPQLSEIEDESLPRLIAENREALEKQYDDGLISHLSELRVKARNGEFYSMCDAIYVDCEKDEPFPYIVLPNQISFDSADERRLIKDIIDEIDGICVETLSEWQQRKLNRYLEMQEENIDEVRTFHFQFINDLCVIRKDDRDSLRELERIEEIQLLNKDNQFCDASTLTAGSVYKPYFDFEVCGIDSLDYLSDLYDTECSEYTGRIFRDLNVHHNFKEEDIDLLENRECAIYFWGTYLLKKEASISFVKQLISDNKFDDIACIPTKEEMKCPSDLYYGIEVSKYTKYVEDWENKVPLTDLPDIELPDGTTVFSGLPFKESLDFLDALFALVNISSQEKRTKLLEWMIDGDDGSYGSKINEYRNDEHALWNNNRNEKVQIKELYALDYNDKTLDQYFGTNPRIVNKAYFPTGNSFRKACEMLGITTITSDDLIMEPVGDTICSSQHSTLQFYILIIAGMTNYEKWKDLYSGYCHQLDKLVLHRCDSIMITYSEDNDINQSLKKFYHKEGENDFYFVESLDSKRVFKSFVDEFIEYLGIDTNDIAEDVIEDIMDSRRSALEIAKEQNILMLDDEFKDELDNFIPGIKSELSGNEADDNDDSENTFRPRFTTKGVSSYTDEQTEDEIEDDSESSVEGEYMDELEEETETASDSNEDNIERNHHPKREQTPGSSNTKSIIPRNFSDMVWWNDTSRRCINTKPQPFSPDDVENFGSKGVPHTLEILEPQAAEIAEINAILGENLSSEQIADLNYLAQLRLYNSLEKRGLKPDESKDDFIKSTGLKSEHALSGGKYIHKCSAVGGIMYISPAVWNKLSDGRCVVCVYLGAKANEFKYFKSKKELLEWIGEDDIVIKLTGKDKADVVDVLYSSVLKGVKGTAYTLIRIVSNEKYNSVFAPLSGNDITDAEENEDEY